MGAGAVGALLPAMIGQQEGQLRGNEAVFERQRALQQFAEEEALRQAQVKELGARTEYFSGRNQTAEDRALAQLQARMDASDAAGQNRQTELAEQHRHNLATEQTERDRLAIERSRGAAALRGDPVEKQVRDAALKLYEEKTKSPGKDRISGKPLPGEASDQAMREVRAALGQVYGDHIVNQVLGPAAPVPPPSPTSGGNPNAGITTGPIDPRVTALHQQATAAIQGGKDPSAVITRLHHLTQALYEPQPNPSITTGPTPQQAGITTGPKPPTVPSAPVAPPAPPPGAMALAPKAPTPLAPPPTLTGLPGLQSKPQDGSGQ